MQAADHSINWVPSHLDILQKLMKWKNNMFSLVVKAKPVLAVTIFDCLFKILLALTWCSDWSHYCTTQCNWISLDSFFECLFVRVCRRDQHNKLNSSICKVGIVILLIMWSQQICMMCRKHLNKASVSAIWSKIYTNKHIMQLSAELKGILCARRIISNSFIQVSLLAVLSSVKCPTCMNK